MHVLLTGKTRALGAALAALLALGTGLVLRRQTTAPTPASSIAPATTGADPRTAPPSPPRATPQHAFNPPPPGPSAAGSALPGPAAPGAPPQAPVAMSVEEWLKNGPKEPLTPPVVEATAEPAPGSTFTAEPLTPPVVQITAEPAPGGTFSPDPLTPPVVTAEGAPAEP